LVYERPEKQFLVPLEINLIRGQRTNVKLSAGGVKVSSPAEKTKKVIMKISTRNICPLVEKLLVLILILKTPEPKTRDNTETILEDQDHILT